MLSDDHSVPHLGCYGDPVIKTPNLDRFAGEGMRFDRGFMVAPQCVPARASLMTGRRPSAVRMARFNSPLPPDVVTLPELLRAEGYHCGAGRRNFHLDGPGRPGELTGQIIERHGLRTWDGRVDWLDRGSPRDETPAKTNEFLDGVPEGSPFFLWLSFNDPHHPWDADAIPEPHDPEALELPPYLPDLPGVRADLARYYGEVSRMDEEFQWVLDVLAERGLSDDTIVMFMGDNGYAFPHGKGSLYEPGLHVPLLMRWPGAIEAGSAASELVASEDVAPTLLEAAGVGVPEEMTGQSVLKLLRGEGFAGRRYIFGERGVHGNATMSETTKANGFDLSRSVRSERYKLIYNCTPYQQYAPVDSANDPGWQEILAAHEAGTLDAAFERAYFTHPRPICELFDLENDPGELENLAGRPELAEVERELREALQEKMIVDYDFLPLPLRE
jgi:arylsulfatase A-like enzyme